MTRQNFDQWFRNGSPLRQLAADIAAVNGTYGIDFLSNTKALPHNFLANAEVGGSWHKPSTYRACDIADWKSGIKPRLTLEEQRGFTSLTPSGLSLMFDPFVDAFLAVHRVDLSGCTVIVLSDYSPLINVIPVGSQGMVGDWGLDEAEKTLRGGDTDSTTKGLFNCLFGKGNWKEKGADGSHLEGDGESGLADTVVVKGIRAKRVLVWNFFPMFRGGVKATGSGGLPKTGNWRQQCWTWMCRFISAVQAKSVILACSKFYMPLPSASPCPGNVRPNLLPLPKPWPLKLPINGQLDIEVSAQTLPSCVNHLYRVYHPYLWGGLQKDECLTVSDVLNS